MGCSVVQQPAPPPPPPPPPAPPAVSQGQHAVMAPSGGNTTIVIVRQQQQQLPAAAGAEMVEQQHQQQASPNGVASQSLKKSHSALVKILESAPLKPVGGAPVAPSTPKIDFCPWKKTTIAKEWLNAQGGAGPASVGLPRDGNELAPGSPVPVAPPRIMIMLSDPSQCPAQRGDGPVMVNQYQLQQTEQAQQTQEREKLVICAMEEAGDKGKAGQLRPNVACGDPADMEEDEAIEDDAGDEEMMEEEDTVEQHDECHRTPATELITCKSSRSSSSSSSSGNSSCRSRESSLSSAASPEPNSGDESSASCGSHSSSSSSVAGSPPSSCTCSSASPDHLINDLCQQFEENLCEDHVGFPVPVEGNVSPPFAFPRSDHSFVLI